MDISAADDMGETYETGAPAIVHEFGAVRTSRVPLHESLVIGREQGDIRIPDDPYLSGTHARIERTGDEFRIHDCGSRNGTFVQVRRAIELRPGDEILIGGQLFRVEI